MNVWVLLERGLSVGGYHVRKYIHRVIFSPKVKICCKKMSEQHVENNQMQIRFIFRYWNFQKWMFFQILFND